VALQGQQAVCPGLLLLVGASPPPPEMGVAEKICWLPSVTRPSSPSHLVSDFFVLLGSGNLPDAGNGSALHPSSTLVICEAGGTAKP
jgi:hypothetical protein